MTQQTRPAPARRESPLGVLLAVLIAVVVLSGLFLFSMGAQNLGHEDMAAAAPVTSATTRPSPPPPGIGDAVRDGKFEFVVSRVDCSQTSVGLEHFKRTAEGKYCVVSLSVRNIAGKPQYFLGSAQKAFDEAGTSFGDDEIAGLYANHETQTFLRKISPGDKVSGNIVFDVPKTTTLATIELHDSFLSGGVRVRA